MGILGWMMRGKKLDYLVGLVAVLAFFLLLFENSGFFAPYSSLILKFNLIVLAIFIADVLLGFMVSSDKLTHIKRNWFNLIVFVPLIQFIHGVQDRPFFAVTMQLAVIARLVSRTRRAQRFIALLGLRPAQLMLASFAVAIGFGAMLLMLPMATTTGARIDLTDALFTATSAACVTGLIVFDTGTYFSLFGQLVILSLIQIGALGIMTFSVLLTIFLGKGMTFRQQLAMRDVLDQEMLGDVRRLITFIIKMTMGFEAVGCLILFFGWSKHSHSLALTLYQALFHAISAFCNAGFSLFSDSLIRFADDPLTNGTVAVLIISGGLGFMVMRDLLRGAEQTLRAGGSRRYRLRIQTRIVLSVSALLVLFGAALLYGVEQNNAFAPERAGTRILLSVFQSVTARTAGFNTCDISALSASSALFIILLMFVGASPGSTGGGIKTTTVSVLWATILSGFRQKENVEVLRRTIPPETIRKAITLLISSMVLVFAFAEVLLYTEKAPFADVLFETVSAFGTVGLSRGITSALTTQGKLCITFLMFAGRLGPLTMAYSFLVYRKRARYSYPEERVMIG